MKLRNHGLNQIWIIFIFVPLLLGWGGGAPAPDPLESNERLAGPAVVAEVTYAQVGNDVKITSFVGKCKGQPIVLTEGRLDVLFGSLWTSIDVDTLTAEDIEGTRPGPTSLLVDEEEEVNCYDFVGPLIVNTVTSTSRIQDESVTFGVVMLGIVVTPE